MRGLEIPGPPVRESHQGRRRPTAEVVVGTGDVERPLRVRQGAGHVAGDESQPGAVHGDLGGEPTERVAVHHHHLPRRPLASVRRRVHPSLRIAEPRLDAVDVARRHESPDVPDGQHRPDAEQLVGQGLVPAPQRGLLPFPAHPRHRAFDQIRRPLELLGSQGVVDRRGSVAVPLAPVTGPDVQCTDAVGVLVEQSRPQHLAEEMVVAVPPTAVVERDQEEISALESLEHGLAAVLTGDGVAQRTREPAQDGRLQQEAAHLFRLTLEDLLDQVVHDEAVVPGEARDEARHVVAPLHRQRGQLQRRDPALGTSLQRGDLVRRQRQPHLVAQVRGRFVRREAQVGGADLDQLPPCPEPG
jgi:hypothetical protein